MDRHIDVKQITAAMRSFIDLTPGFLKTAENFAILQEEAIRLIEEENQSPDSILTFRKAFSNKFDALQLDGSITKLPESMSAEELSRLPEREKEKLPPRLEKILAEYEMRQRFIKPPTFSKKKALHIPTRIRKQSRAG